MPDPRHSKQTLADGIHAAISYEYADAAARVAASGFVAEDKYKLALQLNNNSIWLLTDPLTPTWVELTATGALPAFGQNAAHVESLGLDTTGSTVFQTKLAYTTPSGLNGTFRVGWMAVVRQTGTGDAVETQLLNVTDAAVVGIVQQREPKDVNDRMLVGGFAYLVFSGSAKTFEIQYRQQRGGTAGIQDAHIEFWRVA